MQQRYLAFASLPLMTSLAVDRTIGNVYPPAAVPQNYGSGHLIRVFRDIGRIFSLLFLPKPSMAHWSSADREGSKRKMEYGSSQTKSGKPCRSPATRKGRQTGDARIDQQLDAKSVRQHHHLYYPSGSPASRRGARRRSLRSRCACDGIVRSTSLTRCK